jgi:hypothetical protein
MNQNEPLGKSQGKPDHTSTNPTNPIPIPPKLNNGRSYRHMIRRNTDPGMNRPGDQDNQNPLESPRRIMVVSPRGEVESPRGEVESPRRVMERLSVQIGSPKKDKSKGVLPTIFEEEGESVVEKSQKPLKSKVFKSQSKRSLSSSPEEFSSSPDDPPPSNSPTSFTERLFSHLPSSLQMPNLEKREKTRSSYDERLPKDRTIEEVESFMYVPTRIRKGKSRHHRKVKEKDESSIPRENLSRGSASENSTKPKEMHPKPSKDEEEENEDELLPKGKEKGYEIPKLQGLFTSSKTFATRMFKKTNSDSNINTTHAKNNDWANPTGFTPRSGGRLNKALEEQNYKLFLETVLSYVPITEESEDKELTSLFMVEERVFEFLKPYLVDIGKVDNYLKSKDVGEEITLYAHLPKIKSAINKLIRIGVKLEFEETNDYVHLKHKISLQTFLENLKEIVKDNDISPFFYRILRGKTHVKFLMGRIELILEMRKKIRPLLNQEHYIHESEGSKNPILQTKIGAILISLTRGETEEQEFDHSCFQYLFIRHKEDKDSILINNDEKKSIGKWLETLFQAIYAKRYAKDFYSVKDIQEQVAEFFKIFIKQDWMDKVDDIVIGLKDEIGSLELEKEEKARKIATIKRKVNIFLESYKKENISFVVRSIKKQVKDLFEKDNKKDESLSEQKAKIVKEKESNPNSLKDLNEQLENLFNFNQSHIDPLEEKSYEVETVNQNAIELINSIKRYSEVFFDLDEEMRTEVRDVVENIKTKVNDYFESYDKLELIRIKLEHLFALANEKRIKENTAKLIENIKSLGEALYGPLNREETFIKIPCFSLLQSLANGGTSSSYMALQALFPFMHKEQTNKKNIKYAFSVKSHTSASASAEICVYKSTRAKVVQRKWCELELVISEYKKEHDHNGRKLVNYLAPLTIPIGSLLYETHIKSGSSHSHFALKLSNFILYQEIPKKFELYKTIVKEFQEKILVQLKNYKKANPKLTKGSLVLPNGNQLFIDCSLKEGIRKMKESKSMESKDKRPKESKGVERTKKSKETKVKL